jgi:hypothetical protein
MEQALADLGRLGAVIVEPIRIAEIDTIPPPMLFCFRFKFDINDYLPRLAPDAPVKSLEDIIKSGSTTRRSRSGCSTAGEAPLTRIRAATRPPGTPAVARGC